jgi:hypothetical protein
MPKKPVKTLVEPGAIIDGFTIGECVHRGGMATPQVAPKSRPAPCRAG